MTTPARTKTSAATVSEFTRRTAVERLYAIAEDSVKKTWGDPEQLLGPVLYRALLAEELLRLAACQHEDAGAETVQFMIKYFWALLVENHPCA